MGHITISEDIAAPVDAVFDYVDEHSNTTKYMKDLTKWKPVGPNSHGKGAKFAVAMKAGPMTLSSVVDITTWTQNAAIGWTSVEGFKQTGRWTFTSRGDGTTATFDLEYELPGGIASKGALHDLGHAVPRGEHEVGREQRPCAFVDPLTKDVDEENHRVL